jgi:predicted glutamine amidotransferase
VRFFGDMCRMMGLVAPRVEPSLLEAFRAQASRGRHAKTDAPGHHDGWGIVVYDGDKPRYAGRSGDDATTDPQYGAAVRSLRERPAHGVALAHVRAASAGARTADNAHPFVDGPYAFCHNGTVFDLAPPGQSDSRALFAEILREIRAGRAAPEAIRAVSDRIDREHTYSSTTLLLTDGRTVWGHRRVGNDPVECATGMCASDYYTLGVGKVGDALVVSQEREFLRLGDAAWMPVPDDGIVRLDARGWRLLP